MEVVVPPTKLGAPRLWARRLAAALSAIAVWVAIDLTVVRPHDLQEFDGHRFGALETEMWRSYYDHHPVRLFEELTSVLRTQYRFSFWRSCLGGYYAAKAAVVFQAGHQRTDYLRALPDLERYYSLIRRGSNIPFDDKKAAALELEWWIIHRERAQHPSADLVDGLAALQAEIYQRPAASFTIHAQARAEAMLIRDARAESGGVSEADWRRIGELLDRSWVSLEQAVRR
jgi:hypothetical protein